MLFRALFWIAVVFALSPHKPDLGLGRPGAMAWVLGSMKERLGTLAQESRLDCGPCATRYDATLVYFDSLQSRVIGNLLRIKADIEEQERARLTAHIGAR